MAWDLKVDKVLLIEKDIFSTSPFLRIRHMQSFTCNLGFVKVLTCITWTSCVYIKATHFKSSVNLLWADVLVGSLLSDVTMVM